MNLDQTDKTILKLLLADSDLTLKDLAKQIHLSAPAASERLKRLKESGVIRKYTIDIDHKMLGFDIIADILVLFWDMSEKEGFIDFIQGEPEITTAFETMGRSDVMLRVICKNMNNLLSLVKRIQKYGHTETYMHMGTYKDFRFELDSLYDA